MGKNNNGCEIPDVWMKYWRKQEKKDKRIGKIFKRIIKGKKINLLKCLEFLD